ncbi:beta family protein [Aminobacter aganoensis]|uniref:beta family protein n=1 Tax=Aminobacter aganoensis TaxID=83264 RepID=UPI001613F694
MPYRYIPIVRTKAGEADALGNLSPAARARIFPLIRLGGAVPTTFLPKMIASAAGFQIALEGIHNFTVTGSAAVYTALFNRLGAGGVPTIPTLSLRAQPAYNIAAAALVGAYGPGFVLHVPLADLPHLATWVASVPAWNPKEIDVLIDVAGVAEHPPIPYANYVAHTINASMRDNHPWRSVALHSWSAPKDHGPLNPGRNDVQRLDWQTGQLVRDLVHFQLDYSDSGHVHPSLDEVPGYAMANATVSVRYAIDDIWVIHKGVRTSGANGIDMGTQYRGHAQTLVADPAFGGLAAPCWGDGRIQHYAVTPGGAGGRGQWAALLLNRHMSHVADRLP